MKSKLLILILLLTLLTVVFSQKDTRVINALLSVINPIKQTYQTFVHNVQDKSQNYIFQKESIKALRKENRILRTRLLEQIDYIHQVKRVYDVFPYLSQIPLENISITDTISYVKLNSFSQIILTKPDNLEEDRLYGLIQGDVVGGIAKIENAQLYGLLTSDEKCRFSVFIGEDKTPGIAMGLKADEMIVKFIPKWSKMKTGDKVVTSGLDGIFFSDIPVGIVTKIDVQSTYTVAYIKTYNDIFHPEIFFLVNNASPYLNNNAQINVKKLPNTSVETPSSAKFVLDPTKHIDQTQEDVVEPETPLEGVKSFKKP
ncbi:MAG: cell shape-determining protein MreC [Pseudomonadota bacterium]|jgi:rod shape-determining protein MreC